MNNFAKKVLEAGGRIRPLIIPSNLTNGTGLMNPSIINDEGVLRVILRHVNYTFYHSERKLFNHPFGPLTYIHPENDMHLRTWNWYLELDDDLNVTRYDKIDTSNFDTYPPQWDFVGLEDSRIIKWNGDLWITGVRRDTTPNGQGRMELSKISILDNSVVETERYRVENPINISAYCEKNWMPILDKEWHFVKWSNPTEVVKADITKIIKEDQFSKWVSSTQISEDTYMKAPVEFRGGSQVIPWKEDTYIAIIHEVDLFNSENGRKDAVYRHRFLQWDKNFKLIKYSPAFLILNGHVEFAVGMCNFNDKLLITFGFQDNAAYVLETTYSCVEELLNADGFA
jgi:predicted GH43/DUF377 family glycosyl hydrolase